MVLDISPHIHSVGFSPEGAVRARLLKFSKGVTAHSIYPIELKLCRMIPYINLHNRYEQDFLGAGEGLRISKFFADVICTGSLVSSSQKSLSARSER